MKLASGVAPVAKMLALGMAVGLGTDGPAGSNNDFDMFEEMDLAANLQKVATGDPQSAAGAAGAGDGHDSGGAGARDGEGNRLARGRQARGHDRRSGSTGRTPFRCTTCIRRSSMR